MLILSPELLANKRRAVATVADGSANDDTAAASGEARYERLVDAGRKAKQQGDLGEALRHFDRALDEAHRLGEPERVDRATCNRMAVAIALGDAGEARGALRDVLMRRASDTSAFLAADSLSWAYELEKDFKKGLFYAQVARNHAQAADRREWLAGTLNQTGNCLVGDSRFEEAAEAYRQALDLLSDEPSETRAGVLLNLGYCASVMDQLTTAFGLTLTSLRWARRFGNRRLCGWAHLDLCHAYVHVGRIDRALQHGARALEIAEEIGESDLLKNVLFMYGEAQSHAGDLDAAYDLFHRLQRDYYPDQPGLVDVMMTVDLRPLVNLRA